MPARPKKVEKLWKNSAFRSYFAIAGSILLGVAIIAFCVTFAINNNHTAHTAVVTTRDIAAEHNNKVDELAEKNNQFLKTLNIIRKRSLLRLDLSLRL